MARHETHEKSYSNERRGEQELVAQDFTDLVRQTEAIQFVVSIDGRHLGRFSRHIQPYKIGRQE